MPRTPKSSKGFGYGRRRHRGKKTLFQKEAEASGRLFREMIEKQVRKDNPRMNEKQIRIETKRKITESKKPKPSGE